MAGFDNEVMFALGERLQASTAQAITLMQQTATDVSNVNFSGNPNGTVAANPSSLSHDPTSGNLWLKATGTGNTGWVLITSGGSTTFTADSGSATPAAGNINIFGLSGSKTSATGSTLTIKSPPYANVAAPATVTLNSGSFATAAITLTTPLSAGLSDGDLIEVIATNGVVVIQLQAAQVAHLGSAVTSAGGTITGSATGDSLRLRYQSSTDDWWSTGQIGIWTTA